MIVSILIGRKGSKSFPQKNIYKIHDIPLAVYPMKAANQCRRIDKNYISTDDEKIMQLGDENGFEIIERPLFLAKDSSLSDDVYIHAYNYIKQENKGENIDIIIMLMCNAPVITTDKILEGINILEENNDYDSAITVSRYNMWTPIRAQKIGDDNLLHPFISVKELDNFKNINCDRD